MKSQPSIRTWHSIGSPAAAELASLCGFDWVLIDLEHGCATESAVPDQLRALRARTQGIVRVAAPHADLIARVLDWGAHGIMEPRLNSAAEAGPIIRAALYWPHGQRGFSRTVRAHAYGLRAPDETPAPILMTQIETSAGVEHAGEIAKVDGIDVLFVGPADLEHELGHRSASAGDYKRCLARVVDAARSAGKEAGILLRDTADLTRHVDLGFTRIAIDSDLAILRVNWQRTLDCSRKLA